MSPSRDHSHTEQPSHHPGEAFLLDYAAGGLSGAFAVAVATHLTYCPECRRQLQALEAIGGAILEDTPEVACADGALERVMALLDKAPSFDLPARQPRGIADADWRHFPTPLRRFLADGEEQGGHKLAWQPVLRGFEKIVLDSDDPGVQMRLLRFAGGWSAPRHKQSGTELVVVLDGGFVDQFGRYGVGDISVVEPQVTHQPVADSGGCLCLSAWEGPMKLTGALGWAINSFIKI